MGYKDVKRNNPDKKTNIIAIINQKGGVGKSTTAVNLSAALGEKKRKVLVIDFDPQGNTTSGYGIEKDELENDIYNALSGNAKMSEIIEDTMIKHVFVVPSTIQLAGAEIELVSAIARESVLKNLIEEVADDFDYVFIDCPPSLGLLTVNALVAADSLLIPIQCEYYALEGLTKLIESMRMVQGRLNPSLEIFGVLMTMYDGRTTLSKQVVEEVKQHFGKLVFKNEIPRNVKLSEAPSHGEPVTIYAPDSKGAKAYAKVAKEVIKRG